MKDVKIYALQGNPKTHLNLLLSADPDEGMIDRYLSQSRIYVLEYRGEPACQAVILPIDEKTIELKNLATEERFQKRGLARHMIQWLCEEYGARYERLIVGTSRQGCYFYQRCGFRFVTMVPHFFTDHYPHPIYELGEQCVNLYYLERKIKEPWI